MLNLASSKQFTEDTELRMKREISLNDWPYTRPSKRDMANAGWIVHDRENNIVQCPHCHMQYSKWKADDDPRLIHQHLAPLCPFILAENPFSSSSIPHKMVGNIYTNEVINNAGTQPYDGVIPTNDHYYSVISNRQDTFQVLPNNSSMDNYQLAQSGFYYLPHQRCIKCFYCAQTRSIVNFNIQSCNYLKQWHILTGCRYAQQLNDHDPMQTIGQSKTPE